MSDSEEEAPPHDVSNTVEVLCGRLLDGDPYARRPLESYIKKMYRDNGGLPVKTSSMLSTDIVKLTNEELVNVIDNMITQVNRNKKTDMTDKAIRAVTNVTKLGCYFTGISSPIKLMEKIDDDIVLRNSVVELALGKNVSPKPLVTLCFSLAEYLSGILLHVLENGKHNEDVRALYIDSTEKKGSNNPEVPGDRELQTPM